MDNSEMNIKKYFTDGEWETLMASVHSLAEDCDEHTMGLKRRYWRLKKAQSRDERRTARFKDPGFQEWLERRGIELKKYSHKLWREYMIDRRY